MKLASLFRSSLLPSSSSLCRRYKPRVSQQTLFQRKEAKRLKFTNTLDNQFTNEKTLELMTPKRVKSMGLYFQKIANLHPQLTPIDPKTQQHIKTKFSQASDYQYWKWRNEELQMEGFMRCMVECEIEKEVATLPRNILNEMKELDKAPASLPNVLADESLYLQQYELVLPEEEYEKKMLLERLGRSLEGFVPTD